ncbi:MAG: zinc-binding protein [Thermogutta sp.]|nr:zinc-binding protein [Thermogutta sp.]
MAEDNKQSGCCSEVSKPIVLTCSGASNLGRLADLAARKMTADGIARMSCLAGVAGGVDMMRQAVAAAPAVLVLDGCDYECGRKVMEKAGFPNFHQVRLDRMGMKRGETPVTGENVHRVVGEAARLLGIAAP